MQMNDQLHSWATFIVGGVTPERRWAWFAKLTCKNLFWKLCKIWGSHGSECVECYSGGCDTSYSCRNVRALRRNLLLPYSG